MANFLKRGYRRLKEATAFVNWGFRVEQTRFNPTRFLTPEGLARQLDDFRNGRFSTVGQTFDVIESREPMAKITAPKRKASPTRYGWEILTTADAKENPTVAQEHKEALEYFFNNITATDVTDEDLTGGLKLLIKQMMNAVGVKYAVHEINWKPQPDGNLKAELRNVPLWFFEHSQTKMRFLREQGQYDGEEMKAGEWMVTVGDDLMVATSICYMFRRMSFQDWVNFCEKFGIPGVHGQTKAKKGTPEYQAMKEAVANFANDFGAITNVGDMISLIERKGGGSTLPFPPLVELCDRYIASLWRGADLSTISKGEGMGASLQEDETDILVESDLEMLNETLQTKLARFVIEWKFGAGVEPLAYIQIKGPKKDTVTQDLEVDRFLSEKGFPLSKQGASERYQRPLPDEDDELLEDGSKEGNENQNSNAPEADRLKQEKARDKTKQDVEDDSDSKELANEFGATPMEASEAKAVVFSILSETLDGELAPLLDELLGTDMSIADLISIRDQLPVAFGNLMAPATQQLLQQAFGALFANSYVQGATRENARESMRKENAPDES